MANDREFLDVVAWVETGRDNKKKLVPIGYAYKNDKGGISVQFSAMPVGRWDGSAVIQKRQPRDGQQPQHRTTHAASAQDPMDTDDLPF